MPRKTTAQLAAEEAEAAALLAAEGSDSAEMDALLEAGYEAGEDETNWHVEEDDLAALEAVEAAGDYDAFKDDVVLNFVSVLKKNGTDSGDPYLNVEWAVDGGPHDKAHIWDIIMLRGKGLGFAKKKLNQLGISIAGLNAEAFDGLRVNAKTRIQKGKDGYDDKTVIAKYLGRADVVAEEELPE